MRIYRYELNPLIVTEIQMPKAAQILRADFQVHRDKMCLWALVDTTRPMEARRFIVWNTGDECPYDLLAATYISTLYVGEYVFHVFEVRAD